MNNQHRVENIIDLVVSNRNGQVINHVDEMMNAWKAQAQDLDINVDDKDFKFVVLKPDCSARVYAAVLNYLNSNGWLVEVYPTNDKYVSLKPRRGLEKFNECLV